MNIQNIRLAKYRIYREDQNRTKDVNPIFHGNSLLLTEQKKIYNQF